MLLTKNAFFGAKAAFYVIFGIDQGAEFNA